MPELPTPLFRVYDRVTDQLAAATRYLTLAMVLVGSFNAIGRYLGRFVGATLSSNRLIELQWYLFSLVFLLSMGYALKRDNHVRVDVFYSRLPERAKALVNFLGTLVLLIPFTLSALIFSWPAVRNSFVTREISPDPGGLPRYPLKLMILIGFFLLFLQGIVELSRSSRLMRSRSINTSSAGGSRGH